MHLLGYKKLLFKTNYMFIHIHFYIFIFCILYIFILYFYVFLRYSISLYILKVLYRQFLENNFP